MAYIKDYLLKDTIRFNIAILNMIDSVDNSKDLTLLLIHLGQYVLYKYSEVDCKGRYKTGAEVVKRI